MQVHVVGRDIGQAFYPLQKICHMPKHILYILVRGICHVRKDAKGGNIDEMLLVKGSHIAWKILSLHCDFCSLQHIPRDLQASCKIIDGTRWNVADGKLPVTAHHPLHHFIDRSVPSAADHQIIVIRKHLDLPDCILFLPGRMHRQFIPCIRKDLQDMEKLCTDLLTP